MGFCNFVLHVVFFQEHDIGVWVSRAIPSGNGAKQGLFGKIYGFAAEVLWDYFSGCFMFVFLSILYIR